MSDCYVLNEDGRPRPEPDTLAWARWFETADRTVARDHLPDGTRVSTVFLGIDHNFRAHRHGPNDERARPVLWETMVFGGPNDGYQARYQGRAEALAGHAAVLAWLRGEGERP